MYLHKIYKQAFFLLYYCTIIAKLSLSFIHNVYKFTKPTGSTNVIILTYIILNINQHTSVPQQFIDI